MTPAQESTESSTKRVNGEDSFVPKNTVADNRRHAVVQDGEIDYRIPNNPPPTSSQSQNNLVRANYQELDRQPLPPDQAAAARSLAHQDALRQHQSTNQYPQAGGQNMAGSENSGFRPREFATWAPQSATEMVVEMAAEIRLMREELRSLKSTVEFVRSENTELKRQRDELYSRIVHLEQQLSVTRNAELEMSRKFESLQRYLTEFSRKRQQQIQDLSTLVDLLEQQIRKNQVELNPGQ